MKLRKKGISTVANKTFKLGGQTFIQAINSPDSRGISTDDGFVLVKTDPMLDFYRGLAAHAPKDIMEVGMYEGGSLVWYDKLYQPSKLVGVDVRKEPIQALEDYREANPHVVTYYGRYQQGPGTLAAARQNFPHGIDLVVDDASHLYEESKETFSMLFPMVRAGGHYVLEDWTWSFRPAYQGEKGRWSDKLSLANLVMEIVIMSALTNVIESVHVDRGVVCVRKGPGTFDRNLFDFSENLRGKPFPWL